MKSSRLNSVVSMLIVIILGVILLAYPGDTLTLAARLTGIAVLLVGAVGIVAQLMRKEDRSVPAIVLGAAEVVVGIIVLAAPAFVVSLFPIIAGILVALYGVSDFIEAVNLKKAGVNAVWAMILSAVTVVLGVLVIFNPFGTMAALVRVIGAVLIYKGVTGLLIRLRTPKD